MRFTDSTIIDFGQHKGKTLANVPASYLLWLFGEGLSGRPVLKAYIEDNKQVLEQQAKAERKNNQWNRK